MLKSFRSVNEEVSMKTLAVAVCIVEHDGKFPLIKFKRNYLAGLWGLPGGKLDENEHAPEAAVRELREELGIETEFIGLTAIVDEIAYDQEGSPTRCILFVCRMKPVDGAAPQPRDLPEGTVEWFSPEQIAALEPEIVPSDFRIFKDFPETKWYGTYRSRQEWQSGQLTLPYFEPTD